MQQISLSFRGPQFPHARRKRPWRDLTPEERHRETIKLVCAPTRIRKTPVSLPVLNFMNKDEI